MKHFLAMALVAALVGVVFGCAGRDTTRARLLYGLKVFAEFMCVALVLAWILYFFPR